MFEHSFANDTHSVRHIKDLGAVNSDVTKCCFYADNSDRILGAFDNGSVTVRYIVYSN